MSEREGLTQFRQGVDACVQQYHFVEDGDGGLQTLELRTEADHDVVDQLVIRDGVADHGQGVGEPLHLVEVVVGGHVVLPQRRQLSTELTDTGPVLGGEHGDNGAPDGGRGGAPHHLSEDFLGHRPEKDAQHPLIDVPPDGIGRVGHGGGGLALAGGGGDRRWRCRAGPIEESEPPLAGNVGDHLSPPQQKVRAI